MDFLEEYVTLELETNWTMSKVTVYYLDGLAQKLRAHGFKRSANACECAANRIRRWRRV